MIFQAFKSPHFFKMIGYFVVAAALTLVLGVSITAGSLISGLVSAVVIGFVGMVFGLGATIVLRSTLGLMQTGRFIQYACFFAGTWLGIGIASLVIPTLVVTHGWLAALVVFALAFGSATLTGEVPLKGRTWLPMKMPKRG